jgi:outer membrane protein assembly factor BamB
MNLAPVVGPHDDVIAIHDGRLIAFDHVLGTIRWQVQSQFQGQPSLAKDRIYANDGGNLVVLDELTHDVLWSWQPPFGGLSGPMIVTDSHVLASAGGGVYAVDLATHESVWSYPAVGQLAYADGTLYVASPGGTLTALAPSGPTPFFTVLPCRAVDTRGAAGVPEGGPALDALIVRTLHVAGNCGLPATAKAVSVNVTVTMAGAPGFVNLYAAGDAQPAVSTISYSAGQTRSNNAIVSLNQNGDLAAVANQSPGTTVHLIIDVNGYFE